MPCIKICTICMYEYEACDDVRSKAVETLKFPGDLPTIFGTVLSLVVSLSSFNQTSNKQPKCHKNQRAFVHFNMASTHQLKVQDIFSGIFPYSDCFLGHKTCCGSNPLLRLVARLSLHPRRDMLTPRSLSQGLCLPCMHPFRAIVSLSVLWSSVSADVAGIRNRFYCLKVFYRHLVT